MTRPGFLRARAGIAVLALVSAALVSLAGAAPAHAQQVEVRAEREIYAGLPFTLAVSARGFDESPQPEVAPFTIPGCKVTFLDTSPNVATSITIMNGRRTETRTVEHVFRYRALCEQAVLHWLPAVTVTQGSKKASSKQVSFRAMSMDSTRDMRIELEVPDRPVIVGETFEVAINWYLRSEVRDHSFSVPLFDETTWVDVHQPQLNGLQRRNALSFPAGDREIELPYVRGEVMLDGAEYVRFRFVANLTPIKPGTLTIAPARVMANLIVGAGRDAFGFPASRTRLFKAEDRARTLEVKPLPAAGRPPSFANAVGTGFSIQVQASRTVVKLGEPVELDIVVRGDGRLEGLSLPRLDNLDGLPADLFAVPDTPPTGEIVELGTGQGAAAGKGKRFRVTVQIKSPDVREIPPIAFSFYNPKTGHFETVRSQPIALSVEGTSVVGAGDVVSGARSQREVAQPAAAGQAAGTSAGIGSFVGADLSLSSGAATLARPRLVSDVRVLLVALYALPLLVLGVRLWQVRTRARRDRSSGTRKALRAALGEIDAARSLPAREAGPRVLAALRALATATRPDGLRGADVIARIETEAYSPRAANAPLHDEILDQARKLAQELGADHGRSGAARVAAVIVPWLALASLGRSAHAEGADVDKARAAYQAALAESDRDARTSAFARAEQMFRELVAAQPDRPELLADWGNAALAAQDLGRATLAYRRALAMDPSLARAERNLAWVRVRAPSWLPTPKAQDAGDSLFFWHGAISIPARHLVGAVAFCAAVLLFVPWGRRQRLLRRLAILPALVWLAMLASVLLEEPPTDDAVVIADGVPLLSADSSGAPPALGQPLPAGAEVTVIEARDAWTRIALADGTKGWVASTAVEPVLPR